MRRNARETGQFSMSSIDSSQGTVSAGRVSVSSIGRKRIIPHKELHQKTYFNALQKMLISPQSLRLAGGVKTTLDHQTKIFEDVFKKPPNDYDVNASMHAVPFKRKSAHGNNSMLVGASQTGNLGRSVVITGTGDLTN
jgi:hypothetical protein